MLTLFPIQFLALFAYFILRVTTGLILLYLTRQHFKYRGELSNVLVLPIFPFGKIAVWVLIISEFIVGILLTLGLLTQVGAILLIIISIKMSLMRGFFYHHSLPNRLTYFLLMAVGFSLLITGGGVFAFDLPI